MDDLPQRRTLCGYRASRRSEGGQPFRRLRGESRKKLTARLRWALDNPNAKKIIDDYSRFGQAIPKELTPPELHDVEWSIWLAFWDLSSERQVGFSPGPIPGSAIRRYAAAEQGTGMAAFCTIIRSMDDVYLSHKSGESKPFSRDMIKR